MKRNIMLDEFSDEHPISSDSQDKDSNSVTVTNLTERILRICCKTADGCLGCREIKIIIESSSSSPDSGFLTSSSNDPKFKPSTREVPSQDIEEPIKNVLNAKMGNTLKSNKRKGSVEELPKSKKAKVDLSAKQKKNNKIFDKLLEDFKKKTPSIRTKENQLNGKYLKFDFDGNEIIEHDKIDLPEFIKPSASRHSMSSINTRLRVNNKRKSLGQPVSTTQKKVTSQIKSKNKFDFGRIITQKPRAGTTNQKESDFNDVTNLLKYDLDGNEIIENDQIEDQPEISHTSASKYSLRSINKLPIKLDFEASTKRKNKVKSVSETQSKNDEYTNLLKYDLDGNEIVDNGSTDETEDQPESLHTSTSKYSLRSINTSSEAENTKKSLCKPIKLDFESSTKQKNKVKSLSGTQSKKKLHFDESTNLLKFDLDGNEIVENCSFETTELEKHPEISHIETFIKPTSRYSMRSRSTEKKAENCERCEHPYAKCKQILNFDESIVLKPRLCEPKNKNKSNCVETDSRRKSRKSKIPKRSKTCTTATISFKSKQVTDEPPRTLYDEDSFMHSPLFDSMFELND